jgi:hypothetical protein
VAALVWGLDRKYKFGRGRAFALYVMAYTAGRFWIELLRIDDANHIFGVRLNVFTAGIVFVAALVYFVVVRGPRAYVVPDDAPETAEPTAPVAEGELRAEDVQAVEEGAEPAAETPRRAPKGYQVVSEARFEAYRTTGILPPPRRPPWCCGPTAAAPWNRSTPTAAGRRSPRRCPTAACAAPTASGWSPRAPVTALGHSRTARSTRALPGPARRPLSYTSRTSTTRWSPASATASRSAPASR